MTGDRDPERLYRAQHRRRLSHMPWLYHRLKPEHRAWAEPWQARIRERLMELETVQIDPTAFVAPEARIFAEPGRPVRLGARSWVAAYAFVHGPVDLADDVSVNQGVHLDGGSAGIRVGAGARIANGAVLVAFDHGVALHRPIREQAVRSRGIDVGEDVWIGAGAKITDGVRLEAGAVIGAGAVVTRSVPENAIAVGVPARVVGRRTASGWERQKNDTFE